MYDMTDVHVY